MIAVHKDLLLRLAVVELQHKTAVDTEYHLLEFMVGVLAADADAILQVVDVVNTLDLERNVTVLLEDTEVAVVPVVDFLELNIAAARDVNILDMNIVRIYQQRSEVMVSRCAATVMLSGGTGHSGASSLSGHRTKSRHVR